MRQFHVGIGASHKVNVVVSDELVFCSFCHTAQYADDEFATVSPTCIKGTESVYDFLLGIVAYRACVDEYGSFFIFLLNKPNVLE